MYTQEDIQKDIMYNFSCGDELFLLAKLCKTYHYDFTLSSYLLLRYLNAYKRTSLYEFDSEFIYEGVTFRILSLKEHMPDMIRLTGCFESDIRHSLCSLFDKKVLPLPDDINWYYSDNLLYVHITDKCLDCLYSQAFAYCTKYDASNLPPDSKTRMDDSIGWVYCFYNPDTGLSKIGKSINVRRRKATIEREIGTNLVFTAAVQLSNYSSLESDMHRYFESSRKNGEWFDLDRIIAYDMLHHFNLVAISNGYEILEEEAISYEN